MGCKSAGTDQILIWLEGTGHWWVTSISVWLKQIIDSEEERVTFVIIKDFKGREILLLEEQKFVTV